MKIVDKGVLDASFMDFSTPSEFARSALYYCPQFGHYEYLLSYRLKQSKQMLIGSQNTVEQTFAQLSQQFLEKAARQYGAPFEIQKNVTCCGIEFPMTAGYIKRDGRHFLGIQSNLSQPRKKFLGIF